MSVLPSGHGTRPQPTVARDRMTCHLLTNSVGKNGERLDSDPNGKCCGCFLPDLTGFGKAFARASPSRLHLVASRGLCNPCATLSKRVSHPRFPR